MRRRPRSLLARPTAVGRRSASAVLLPAGALLALAACRDGTGPGELRPTPQAYDLVVESTDSPQSLQPELFVLREGAAARTRILPAFAFAGQPWATSDGRSVVYVGSGAPEDDLDLWIVGRDGTGARRLLAAVGAETHPTVSPDDTRIAFARMGTDDVSHIWTVRLDGTDERRLTPAAATGSVANATPAWSHDGQRLAWASGPPGALDLWVMNADGTNRQRITTDAASEYDPSWSPDGTRLAFVRGTGLSSADLVVRDLVSGRERTFGYARLTRQPVWSPDGRRIAFVSNMAGGSQDVYTVAPDGSGLARWTTTDVPERRPAWIRHD